MAKLKGWKFPIDVDPATGKIMTIEDNDNVKQSVNIILQTGLGERIMRSHFGLDSRRFMFESVDLTLINSMTNSISDVIELWEEHINQLSVVVEQSRNNISSVVANIDYITDIFPQQDSIVKVFDEENLNG